MPFRVFPVWFFKPRWQSLILLTPNQIFPVKSCGGGAAHIKVCQWDIHLLRNLKKTFIFIILSLLKCILDLQSLGKNTDVRDLDSEVNCPLTLTF